MYQVQWQLSHIVPWLMPQRTFSSETVFCLNAPSLAGRPLKEVAQTDSSYLTWMMTVGLATSMVSPAACGRAYDGLRLKAAQTVVFVITDSIIV